MVRLTVQPTLEYRCLVAGRMEYSFTAAAAGDDGAVIAREYDGGSAEWHTFDRSLTALPGSSAQPVSTVRTSTASPVTFRGMPARRFWELEDASVDIGALTAAAEDLGRLLLRESPACVRSTASTAQDSYPPRSVFHAAVGRSPAGR